MTKQLKPYILIVMLAAVLLIGFCLSEYISLGRRLSSLYSQLDESTEKWSRTAAEKETLQVDLKAKQKEQVLFLMYQTSFSAGKHAKQRSRSPVQSQQNEN